MTTTMTNYDPPCPFLLFWENTSLSSFFTSSWTKAIIAVCTLDRKEHNMQHNSFELDGYWVKKFRSLNILCYSLIR
jgi:hypothetical protein